MRWPQESQTVLARLLLVALSINFEWRRMNFTNMPKTISFSTLWSLSKFSILAPDIAGVFHVTHILSLYLVGSREPVPCAPL